MNRIYLIRHCKAFGQEPSAALTGEGLEQAYKLASFLADKAIEAVVSSPFRRAVDTIEPFCKAAKLGCRTDERLVERLLSTVDIPDWTDKLRATYSDLNLKYEGGESSEEAMHRGIAVIEQLLSKNYRCSAVVTHGALLSLILKRYDSRIGFDDWKRMSNPDVYCLSIHGDGGVTIDRVWTGA